MQMPETKKWLFFYLKTGGGHLSPAKALKQSLENISQKTIEIDLIDGLDGALKPAKWLIEDGYRISINYIKWIFELLYALNKWSFFGKLSTRMVLPIVKKQVEKSILSGRPGKIIIFHYFLIEPVYKVLEDSGLNVPVFVVVTDPYTAHPIWFHNKKPQFIVFSERLRLQLIQKGFNSLRVHRFQQIVNPKFERQFSADNRMQIYQHNGLDPQRKTILIFGGGDGLKKGLQLLRSLIKINVSINIIMVCGRNTLMYNMAQKLVKRPWKSKILLLGFVDNIEELLTISDIVISKCGASALAEMLVTQKIPVIVDYIWEQEKGNVDFILDNNLGFYEKRISKIQKLIVQLLSDDALFEKYHRNLQKLNYQNGVDAMAGFLLN